MPVELTVEIGRTTMTIGETLAIGPGSIVSLNRAIGEPVDLLVNGKRIARGEVVAVDEEFGLRVTEIDPAELAARSGLGAGPARLRAPAPAPILRGTSSEGDRMRARKLAALVVAGALAGGALAGTAAAGPTAGDGWARSAKAAKATKAAKASKRTAAAVRAYDGRDCPNADSASL